MPDPENIVFIEAIAIFVLFGVSFVKPFCGLLCYFTVMMTRIGLHYPALENIRIELLIAVVVFVEIFMFGKAELRRLRFEFNPVNKYLSLFVLVIMLSFLQAMDYGRAWNVGVMEFLKIYVFFVMILFLVETEKQVRSLLWVFSFLTVMIGYEGIYGYLTGQASFVFQGVEMSVSTKGFATGHVAAANMQLQALPVMIYLVLAERKLLVKGLAGFLACLSTMGVVGSGSRGGFVGLVVIGLFVAVFSKRRLLALVVCACGFALSVPLLSRSYLSWMGSVTEASDVSAVSRITGLVNGFEMMMRRPLLGVGPECYSVARKAWFGWGLEAHNHLGQVMGDLGALGTVAWGFFIFGVFKNLSQAKEKFKEAGNGVMIYIIIGIQVSILVRLFEGMFSHSLYIFFWYMMAALSIAILKVGESGGRVGRGAL